MHQKSEDTEIAIYDAVIDCIVNTDTKHISANADNLGIWALRSRTKYTKLIVLSELTSWDIIDPREEQSERFRLGSYNSARDYIVQKAPHLSNEIQECFSDFLSKNTVPAKLPKKLGRHLKYVFLNQDEEDKLWQYSLPVSWHNFFEKYPDSQGLMTLSKVGFNASASHALVFVSNSNFGIGGAAYYLFAKENDLIWKIHYGVLLYHSS